MTKHSLYEDLVLQLEAEGDAFVVTREWLVAVQYQLSFRQNVVSPLILPPLIEDDDLDELDTVIIHNEPTGHVAETTQSLVDWYNAVKDISQPVDITTMSFTFSDGSADELYYHVMLNGCRTPFIIQSKGRHWGLYNSKRNKHMLVQAHSIQDIIAKLAILWNSKI